MIRKTCFFAKLKLPALAQLCEDISNRKCKCIQFNILTFWHFKRLLHENEAVPRFTSCNYLKIGFLLY